MTRIPLIIKLGDSLLFKLGIKSRTGLAPHDFCSTRYDGLIRKYRCRGPRMGFAPHNFRGIPYDGSPRTRCTKNRRYNHFNATWSAVFNIWFFTQIMLHANHEGNRTTNMGTSWFICTRSKYKFDFDALRNGANDPTPSSGPHQCVPYRLAGHRPARPRSRITKNDRGA